MCTVNGMSCCSTERNTLTLTLLQTNTRQHMIVGTTSCMATWANQLTAAAAASSS